MPHPFRRLISVRAVVALVAVLVAVPALGVQIQRTFVRSTGVDTNPCSLAAPCRSFTAAIANTLPGGEVVILDTAAMTTN